MTGLPKEGSRLLCDRTSAAHTLGRVTVDSDGQLIVWACFAAEPVFGRVDYWYDREPLRALWDRRAAGAGSLTALCHGCRALFAVDPVVINRAWLAHRRAVQLPRVWSRRPGVAPTADRERR